VFTAGLQLRCIVVGALVALTTACASSGAVPSPFPRPTGKPLPSSPPASESASPDALVVTALSLRGTPYRDGGADPSGFDCSGLVEYVFARQGISVPRTVLGQFQAGQEIDAGSMVPGDLVFFSTVGPGASHVGILIAPGAFVHAPSESGVVRVEPIAAPYWASRFVGARRLRAP
jgi:cell wall-associated NlpC family hydrolase